jgi:hypothetical protein
MTAWKLALLRSAVAYGVEEVKIVIKETCPGFVIPLVTIYRLTRDALLTEFGSKAARARVEFVVACAFADPPRYPTGAELKVVSMLARKR